MFVFGAESSFVWASSHFVGQWQWVCQISGLHQLKRVLVSHGHITWAAWHLQSPVYGHVRLCLPDSESLNICCLLLRFIWMGLLRDYDYKPSCGPSFQALLKMYIKWCCISESPGVATYDAATMTLRTMGSGLGTDHLHTTILGRNTWKTRLGDPFHPSVKLANNDHIGFLRIRTPHEH